MVFVLILEAPEPPESWADSTQQQASGFLADQQSESGRYHIPDVPVLSTCFWGGFFFCWSLGLPWEAADLLRGDACSRSTKPRPADVGAAPCSIISSALTSRAYRFPPLHWIT
jgi:hypothetical protein